MAKLMMLNKERIKSVRDVVNKSFDPISEKVDMIADKIVSQSLVSLVDPETVETKLFQPSVYQQAIFDYISLLVRDKNVGHVGHVGQKHVVIEAVAGSGKTKTIEEATKLIPHNMSVCFLAFNRHIAEELKKRAPSNVRAMTLNSLGHNVVMSAMRANGKSVFLEPRKVYDVVSLLLKKEYSRFTQEEMDNIIPVVVRIVSLFKATRMTVSDSSLNYLMDRYNIFNEVDNNVLIQICAKVLYQCTRILERHESSQIDFDDQIWLPVQLNLPVFQYDFVFIDETQDLNAAQLELALRACKKDGSIIAVGDRNQSIYGFRGADVDAIPRIIKRLNAKVFPLSITYRCPVKHVELAKHFVPEIEAAPWAIEGEIIEIKDSDMEQYVRAGDLAICRTNAPLVSPCFALIKKGIKATIRGRDIGEGLITLIKKIKGSSMDEFSIRLDTWASKEREKLEKKGASIESVMDKYETLLVLMEDCDDVDCLIAKIKTIFSDDVSAVIFSSVHRAKGLEAETKDNSVYVLYPNLMPSQWAKKDWELIQERNLQYVAYTRAKNKMYMVW